MRSTNLIKKILNIPNFSPNALLTGDRVDTLRLLTDGRFGDDGRTQHARCARTVGILSTHSEVILEALDEVRDCPPGGAGVGVGTDAPPTGLAINLFDDVAREGHASRVEGFVPLEGDSVTSNDFRR